MMMMEETQLVDKVHEWLAPETNPPNGNCLFNSMSELLFGGIWQHANMRKRVAAFYRDFDATTVLSSESEDKAGSSPCGPRALGSMQYRIALSIIGDSYDDDGGLHSVNIKRNKVWGNLTDVMVLCLLYNVNVVLLHEQKGKDSYTVVPYMVNSDSLVVYLRLCDSHFEAMTQKKCDQSIIGRQVAELIDGTLTKGVVQRFETKVTSGARFMYMVKYEGCDKLVGRTEYQVREASISFMLNCQ